MGINKKQLLFGAASFLPGISTNKSTGTGGTCSARYCYSVWLRHLVLAHQNGLFKEFPRQIAELGPGDSIGIGLAALLSGSESYLGLDVVEHASLENNVTIFDELVELFQKRTAIPGDDEFPNVKPKLKDYSFPANILNDDQLEKATSAVRLELIRNSLRDTKSENSVIRYVAPWDSPTIAEPASLDLIFSQAVLEYVDDLPVAYATMQKWLKLGGWMSHQIDFKSHDTTDEWDGHWACSDLQWKLIRGRRPYFLNRQPHSAHKQQMIDHGLEILTNQTVENTPTRPAQKLAPRFRNLDSNDYKTSGALIQAFKK